MKVLLGVTGGVAAKLTPKLVRMLVQQGHEVQAVATEKALYFFPRSSDERVGSNATLGNTPICNFCDDDIKEVRLWTDRDEWRGHYQKDQDIPHISLTKWADVFAIVPLTANTIGKMAHGICDNLLTSEVMAWPVTKPLILAPAMNTVMWENIILQQNLLTIELTWKCTTVDPVSKRLACGDVGQGALAELDDIVKAINLGGKSNAKV